MTPSLSQRLSARAHAALPHANPLSPAQMQAVSDAVVAWAPDSVLDIGCGPATLAIEIARARNTANGLPLRGELRLMAAEFKASQVPPQGAVICMGSSQVFGKPVEALSECVKLTKHHGLLVFADLVWTSPPPDEFLSFLEIDRGFYWLRSDAIPVFRQLGLAIRQHLSASTESFAEYEQGVYRGRLAFADSLPLADAQAIRARAEAWSSAYESFGKHVLGFDAYVAQRSEA